MTPEPPFMDFLRERNENMRGRTVPIRHPNMIPIPKLPARPLPAPAKTEASPGNQPAPVSRPANTGITSTPVKTYRPDAEYIYHCTIDVEFLFPEPRFDTFRFDVLLRPFMDLKQDERFYSYTFFHGRRAFRFFLNGGTSRYLYEGKSLPVPAFILTSLTEMVKADDKGNRQYFISYTIRDKKHRKRRLTAKETHKQGILEVLEFFFRLQYYDTWEEYDEYHELCPELKLRACDIRDQLRRDLCESGMKLI